MEYFVYRKCVLFTESVRVSAYLRGWGGVGWRRGGGGGGDGVGVGVGVGVVHAFSCLEVKREAQK